MNPRFTLHMACCIGLILFLDTFHDISARLPLRRRRCGRLKVTEPYLELVRLMVVSRCESSDGMKLRLFHSWPSSFVYMSRSVRVVRRKGGQNKENGVAR